MLRLPKSPQHEGVRITDFGTRGHDLAYAILDGYDGVILVDAAGRGGKPGTLYSLELDPHAEPVGAAAGGHGVDLPGVFHLVRELGGTFPRVLLVGCEPADLGPDDEGAVGLSESVSAAVDRAVALVEELLTL